MSISPDDPLTLVTSGPRETRDLGVRLASLCRGGEVIALRGPLGAGKTTFAKGIGEGLGIDARDVTSPTFLLLHELSGRLVFYHIDAYRIGSTEELEDLAVREVFRADSVVLIEWAENVPGLAPEDRLSVEIRISGEHERHFSVSATGHRHESLLARLAGES